MLSGEHIQVLEQVRVDIKINTSEILISKKRLQKLRKFLKKFGLEDTSEFYFNKDQKNNEGFYELDKVARYYLVDKMGSAVNPIAVVEFFEFGSWDLPKIEIINPAFFEENKIDEETKNQIMQVFQGMVRFFDSLMDSRLKRILIRDFVNQQAKMYDQNKSNTDIDIYRPFLKGKIYDPVEAVLAEEELFYKAPAYLTASYDKASVKMDKDEPKLR